MLFCFGVLGTLDDDKMLPRNQLLELVRAGADGILSIGYLGTILVIDGFARDVKFIGDELQQGRRRFFRGKPDRVAIDD